MAKKTTRVVPRPKRHARSFFLKQWRTYRGLTQEQLAQRIGMTGPMISHLENGTKGYVQDTLEALAVALQCEPAHLLMVDPTRDDALWTIWERAGEAERQQIVTVARALTTRTGTDN